MLLSLGANLSISGVIFLAVIISLALISKVWGVKIQFIFTVPETNDG